MDDLKKTGAAQKIAGMFLAAHTRGRGGAGRQVRAYGFAFSKFFGIKIRTCEEGVRERTRFP